MIARLEAMAARFGAALTSPRAALRLADQPRAGGRAMTDVALALVLLIVARKARSLVMAGAFAFSGDISTAGSVVVAAIGAVIGQYLAMIVAGGIVVTALAGKRRSLGRDFDLACVAVIPAIAIELCVYTGVLALGRMPGDVLWRIIGIAAIAWAVALVIVAVIVARGRAPADGEEPPELSLAPRQRLGGYAFFAVVAVCIAIHATIVARAISAPGAMVVAGAGQPAPAFSLPVITDDGVAGPDTVSLEQLHGRVVILELWATWCRPCRASMPIASRVARDYGGRGVVLVSVNVEGRDRARAARKMADELSAESILLAGDGDFAARYGAVTIPTFVIIDADGNVVARRRGFPGASQLVTWLEANLDAAL